MSSYYWTARTGTVHLVPSAAVAAPQRWVPRTCCGVPAEHGSYGDETISGTVATCRKCVYLKDQRAGKETNR